MEGEEDFEKQTQTTEHISRNNDKILTVTKQTTIDNLIDDVNRPNKKRKLIYSSQNDNLRNHNNSNDNNNNYTPSKKRRRFI